MTTGTGAFISQQQMKQVREEIGLNPTHAAREARRFGVNIAGQTIARWEAGGAAADSVKLAGYLDALVKLKQEYDEQQALRPTGEPQHEAVKALVMQVNTAREGLDFFMNTRAHELRPDDMRLLAMALDDASKRFKWASAALNGAAHRLVGRTAGQ